MGGQAAHRERLTSQQLAGDGDVESLLTLQQQLDHADGVQSQSPCAERQLVG